MQTVGFRVSVHNDSILLSFCHSDGPGHAARVRSEMSPLTYVAPARFWKTWVASSVAVWVQSC